MVHLNELQDTYSGKGFTVLAISNEETDLIKGFVDAQGATYPIVAETSDTAKAYGTDGFPSSFLIDPDGEIAWSGHPAAVPEGTIEHLLRKAKLFPKLPARFSSVRKSVEKGHLFEAQTALGKAKEVPEGEQLGEEDARWAEKLTTWLDARHAAVDKQVQRAKDAGDYYKLWKILDEAVDAWKGADSVPGMQEQLKDLLSDKDKKLEIDAGKKLDQIREKLEDASPKKAIKLLEALTSKKYAETKAGKRAAEMIEQYQKEENARK